MQYGTTPLIWAARKGHYDSVMHLLTNGADVDQEGAVSRLTKDKKQTNKKITTNTSLFIFIADGMINDFFIC